jgi:hypothetical protein
MKDLLAKSAVDSALLRKKKHADFIQRGGRVITRELTMTSNHNPSDIEKVDLKTILQKNKENADSNKDDDDDLDYDWEDELGSVDEVESSEEEEEEERNKADDDQDEDEVENSEEDVQMTSRALDVSDADSSSTSKPAALMLPPAVTRCSMSSSSSGGFSSPSLAIPQPPPPGQICMTSKILAPDSTSTDRESSRGSKAPVSEPSETGEVQPLPGSSSPVDLPGFQFEAPSHSAKKHQTFEGSPTLTGFGNVECSGIDGFSDLGVEGFANGALDLFRQPKSSKTGNGVDNASGFSQLFDEDEGDATFTHPPPLLKPKKPRILDDDDDNDRNGQEPGSKTRQVGKLLVADDEDDDMNEIDATCVLPAVNVLPEEKERDMMMMVMGAQDTAVEEDEQPTQYVNHRGSVFVLLFFTSFAS